MRTTLRRSRSAVARAVELGAIEQYAKIGGRAAWSGAQLQQSPWWGCAAFPLHFPLSHLCPSANSIVHRGVCGYHARRTLSASHVDELDFALKMAMRSGAIEWDGEIPMAVGRDVFPLREDGMGGLLRGACGALPPSPIFRARAQPSQLATTRPLSATPPSLPFPHRPSARNQQVATLHADPVRHTDEPAPPCRRTRRGARGRHGRHDAAGARGRPEEDCCGEGRGLGESGRRSGDRWPCDSCSSVRRH